MINSVHVKFYIVCDERFILWGSKSILHPSIQHSWKSINISSDAVWSCICSCLLFVPNLVTVMLSKPGKAEHSYILATVLFGKYWSLSKSKSSSILLWQILHWAIELQCSRVAKEYYIVMLNIKLLNIALECCTKSS